MIFLGNLIEENGKLRVGMVHNQPFDKINGLGKTEHELNEIGVLVNKIPDPQVVEGKVAIMYVNTDTKEVYYEYVDRPLTTEEELYQLKENQADLWELILFGGND